MSFLDRKEDVLDIKLTRHGKKKLMDGEFNPMYYSFHDDGILYDSENANFSEDASEAEERITEKTVYHEAQSLYSSKADDFEDDPTREEELQVKNKLGTADLQGKEAPAYQIDLIDGQIEDFSDASGSLSGSLNSVPQVNVADVEYTVSIASTPAGSKKEISTFGEPDAGVLRQSFSDGTRIEIARKQILLAAEEKNTPVTNNSFEIEVFEVEEKEDGENELKKKFFQDSSEEAFQEIYEPSSGTSDEEELTPNFVEYFLKILVDSEIDKGELCRKFAKTDKGDKFEEELECGDVNKNTSNITEDRYQSDVGPDDIGEKCP